MNESANLVLYPPSIAEAFSPSQVPVDSQSTLTYTITNPSTNAAALTGVAFTDTLPSGLVVAPPNVSSACGGTLTATPGSGSISLTGGSIPATGVCTIALHVTGTTAGDWSNSVTVASTEGGDGNTANATLTVVGPPSIAEAFGAATVPLNGTTPLTFTITNPSANTVAQSGVAFTDSLPFGLVVATPNGLSNTCGGTVTADEQTASISLSGGSIAASSSCEVVVNVTGVTQGRYSNSATVSSTDGGTGNTASAALTVTPPSITGVSPDAGPATGTNTVTIKGTGFTSSSTVEFGSTEAKSVTFVSPTQLTAVAPAEASGVVHVTVTTGGATSATSKHSLYAFGPPTVSSFTPRSGITGTTVTIKGTNFVPRAKVKIGSKKSPKVSFVSTTKLKAVVPNGAVAGKIAVRTAAGTATSSTSFTPTLSITSRSSASGAVGKSITIWGVGFNSSSVVKFNGTTATVTSRSTTQLKATVPTGAASGPITVTNTTSPTGTVRSAASFSVT